MPSAFSGCCPVAPGPIRRSLAECLGQHVEAHRLDEMAVETRDRQPDVDEADLGRNRLAIVSADAPSSA